MEGLGDRRQQGGPGGRWVRGRARRRGGGGGVFMLVLFTLYFFPCSSLSWEFARSVVLFCKLTIKQAGHHTSLRKTGLVGGQRGGGGSLFLVWHS